MEFLKSAGLWGKGIDSHSDMIYVTANMQCNYLQQIYFDEKINIYVKAHSVGNSSVDLHYLATNQEGKACLTGQGVLVKLSKTSGKGIPWSQEEKRKLLNPQTTKSPMS